MSEVQGLYRSMVNVADQLEKKIKTKRVINLYGHSCAAHRAPYTIHGIPGLIYSFYYQRPQNGLGTYCMPSTVFAPPKRDTLNWAQ